MHWLSLSKKKTVYYLVSAVLIALPGFAVAYQYEARTPKTFAAIAPPELGFVSSQAHLEQALSTANTRPLSKQSISPSLVKLDWSVINSHFDTQHPETLPGVAKAIKSTLRHRVEFEKELAQSMPYLTWVAEQAIAQSVPMESALLPLLISGYDPSMKRDNGHVGLWGLGRLDPLADQLIINEWQDERFHATRASQVVLHAMAKNNRQRGDWGSISYEYLLRSRGGVSDKDTHWAHHAWVQLYADVYLIQHAQRYGIVLPKIPKQSQLATVDLRCQLDKEQIARLSGVSVAVIEQWNPALRRYATAPQGDYTLLLPRKAFYQFQYNLPYFSEHAHLRWVIWPVAKASSWRQLSRSTQASISLLKKANNASIFLRGADALVPVYLTAHNQVMRVGLV